MLAPVTGYAPTSPRGPKTGDVVIIKLRDFVLVKDRLLNRGIIYQVQTITPWGAGRELSTVSYSDLDASTSAADQVRIRPCFGIFGSSHGRGELVLSAGNLTVLSLVDIGVEFSKFAEFARSAARCMSGTEEAG